MRKYLLTILIALTAYQFSVYGQDLNKNSFLSYGDVIKELKSSTNISELKNKYDYMFILLLDSTSIDLIEKTGYAYIDEFRNYATGLPLSNQTMGFATEKQDVKEIFRDENLLKRILNCTKPFNSPDIPITKFDYPIYIKDNTAIFETSGPTWITKREVLKLSFCSFVYSYQLFIFFLRIIYTREIKSFDTSFDTKFFSVSK